MAAGVRSATGRLPDDPGDDATARRQPGHGDRARHRAAGAAVRADPLARQHDLVVELRHQPGHAAVRPQPRHRRRRAGRTVGDQRRRLDLAAQPSLSAALFQGEPGRHADRHARADLRRGVDAATQRSRRHADGAAPLGNFRRRPGLGAGRIASRHPHSSGPVATCRLWHRPRRRAQCHRRRQCRRPEGLARRRAAVLHHRRQRSDRQRRRLQVDRHHLQEQRARAAQRHRQCRRGNGEREGRRLVSGQAGGGDRRTASAGRQCDRHGRAHPRATAAATTRAARRRASHRGQRPHRDDPCLDP